MINSILSNSREYKLVSSPPKNKDENIYTVIIGKNGTGKSRLLKDIANFTTGYKEYSSIKKITTFGENKLNFSNIIAVSTNPFDKFPWGRIYNESENYHYLGIKDVISIDTSIGFLKKIIGNYLKAFISKDSSGLGKTLDYLGYNNYLTMKFSYIGGRIIEDIVVSEDDRSSSRLYYYLKERARKGELQLDDYFNKIERENGSIKKEINSILNALRRIEHIHRIRKLDIIIKNGDISLSRNKIPLNEDLITLINCGILKFESASLKKHHTNAQFTIDDASSGEQCVIMSMLGISSLICDDSLILIDEPEVCLHPEWQEKYIQLLTSIFKSYKRCQFIIATHSPQIVSNLSPDRCFVLTMEDGIAKNANEYINKSSDFQLATLFGAPGFKNEYLSRIAIALFAKVSIEKKFEDVDIMTLTELLYILPKISEDDPLFSLINAIRKAKEMYA